MKLKRIALILLATIIVTACSPAIQGFVGMPTELKAIILIAVTAIIARLFEVIADRFPQIDLRQYTTQVAVALAGIVVVIAEHLLGLIPPQYDTIVETLLHLLVLILGGAGTILIMKLNRVPGFRQE